MVWFTLAEAAAARMAATFWVLEACLEAVTLEGFSKLQRWSWSFSFRIMDVHALQSPVEGGLCRPSCSAIHVIAFLFGLVCPPLLFLYFLPVLCF